MARARFLLLGAALAIPSLAATISAALAAKAEVTLEDNSADTIKLFFRRLCFLCLCIFLPALGGAGNLTPFSCLGSRQSKVLQGIS